MNKTVSSGLVQHSSSAWHSSVALVTEINGSVSFRMNYRRLNKVTRKVVYTMPKIEDARRQGARNFASFDLQSNYWQIPMTGEDEDKTSHVTLYALLMVCVFAFSTHWRHLEKWLTFLREMKLLYNLPHSQNMCPVSSWYSCVHYQMGFNWLKSTSFGTPRNWGPWLRSSSSWHLTTSRQNKGRHCFPCSKDDERSQ